MTAIMSAAAEQKFVVLFGGVGNYAKGEVVKGAQLCHPKMDEKESIANLQRLLKAGAIREANNFEDGMEKVQLPDTARRNVADILSYEQTIAALKTDVQTRDSELSRLRLELSVAKGQTVIPQTRQDDTKWIQLVADKDKLIEDLQRQMGDATTALNNAHAHIAQLSGQTADPTTAPPSPPALTEAERASQAQQQLENKGGRRGR